MVETGAVACMCVLMHGYEHVCVTTHMWRLEDNFVELSSPPSLVWIPGTKV